LEFFCQ
jgi:hypothetical protein